MEKQIKTFYAPPQCDCVEVKTEAIICQSVRSLSDIDAGTLDTGEVEDMGNNW